MKSGIVFGLALVLTYETAAQTNLDVMQPHERIPPYANADPSIRHPVSVRVPTKLDIRRTGDSLAIRFTSFVSTNLAVGTNMVVGLKVEKKLYPASGGRTNGSYSVSGGVRMESHENYNDAFTRDRDNIPQPGVKYTYNYRVEVFETDIPGQHMWSPEGGKYYSVLWTKVFAGTIKPRLLEFLR